MKSKSEKFRELLEEEKRLRNQLMDCEMAQSRMLKKAFNGLGLKIGSIGYMVGDESIITVFETTGSHIRYFRRINFKIAPYEISVEDLFDAEVK